MNTPQTSELTLADMISALLNTPKQPKAKASATSKQTQAKGKANVKPIETSPATPTQPEWRLSMRWKDTAIIMTVSVTQCENCNSREHLTQPFLMLQRWHPSFGFHSESIALHDPKHDELPRRLVEVEQRAAFCRHCFLNNDMSQRQMRLFGSTDGVLRTPKGDILLSIFDTNGPAGVIDPAPIVDRGPLPSTLPFFAPLCIAQPPYEVE